MVITRSELDWEISDRKVTEGAEILKYKDRTFLIYSASYCDTPGYKLDMNELIGSDPLNPNQWKQYDEPVFQRGNGVFGPGHNGFFVSPDGTQHWIVYHGNSKEEYGCGSTRSVRAQEFTWTEDGLPKFGVPIPEGEPVKMPSGENGSMKVSVQGVQQQLINRDGKCLVSDGGNLTIAACAGSAANWVLDSAADGAYRLAHVESGTFLDQNEMTSAWVNSDAQRWNVTTDENGWLSLTNRDAGAALDGDQAKWRLAPKGEVAVMSVQSGKALAVADGNVEHEAWQSGREQKWQFSASSEAFYQVQNAGQCLTLYGNPIVPGANVVLGGCDGAIAEWAIVPVGMVQCSCATVTAACH